MALLKIKNAKLGQQTLLTDINIRDLKKMDIAREKIDFDSNGNVTGSGVIENVDNGVFKECQSRIHICQYACCQFGVLNNWIFTLPGEIEKAREMRLSFDHLNVKEMDNGSARFECARPCRGKNFKPIDCIIYPVFIANAEGTQFIVADKRKCPIPNNELIEQAIRAQKICLEWEENYPGTLAAMAQAAKEFIAYQPFPWEINKKDGSLRRLTEEELEAITPNEVLRPDYEPKYKGVDNKVYSDRTTSDDIEPTLEVET